jgi:hypothetical protein
MPKRLVFIFACQRAGTTMLTHCFRRDRRSKVYGEDGLAGTALRLKPYEEIEQIVARERATLLIAKPVVESQHATKLLDHFSNARAIWMYRDYRDVADSSLRRFGTESTIRNLRPVVDLWNGKPRRGSPGDGYSWASEGVSRDTQAIVARYFAEDMPTHDAKALFWYVRNVLFFEQELDLHPRVMLCRYEDLVTHPSVVMRTVYSFLQVQYPGDHIVETVHSASIGVGSSLDIEPRIRHLCDELLQRLDQVRAG